jgi:hypothetical protein
MGGGMACVFVAGRLVINDAIVVYNKIVLMYDWF